MSGCPYSLRDIWSEWRTRSITLTTVFLIFGLVQAADRPDSTSATVSRSIKIVAFGNSITSRRPTIDSVYADRLPHLLMEYGISCEVINSGVGSSHSGRLADNNFAKVNHALDRFETEVLAHKPDVMIIGFGTNDAYIDGDDPNGRSRISLKKYKHNLTYMIKELKKKDVMIVLMAPSPFAFPEERMYQNRRLYTYVKAVRRLAKRHRVGISDNYRLFMDYGTHQGAYAELMPDGVHPNDKGHEIIAHSIAQEIVRYSNQLFDADN